VSGEEQVIAQIRRFLESGPRELTPAVRELAERYAAQCAEVDDRLRQCRTYLNRGLRSEAVNLAETPPSVLELAAILDFLGVEAWREFCADNDLPVAPLIAAEVVSRLNEAYMQEDLLGSLLSEYRKLARRGTLKQKIPLLRRLARLDPDNSNWRQDLVRFERARQEELAQEIDAAVKGEDEGLLTALREEVESAEWAVKPHASLADRLRRRLTESRTAAAQARGKEVAREAWEAYSALDVVRVSDALREWDALLEGGHFLPPPEAAGRVSEARGWFEDEQYRRAQDREFKRAVNALVGALDENVGAAELERRVYAVNKFNREIPRPLRKRVERALEDAQLALRRESRIKLVAIVAFLIAVAVPVFLFVRFAIRAGEREDWAKRIDDARVAQDYGTAEKLLDELRQRRPGFYAEAAFQERAAAVRREADQFKQERANFAKIMRQLDEIRNAGFPSSRPWAELEQMAATYAHTDAEKVQLAEWRIARQAYEDELRKASDAQFSAAVADIIAQLDRLAGLDAEREHAEYGKLLDETRASLKAARRIPMVSEHLIKQVDGLGQRIASCTTALAQASQRLARQAELREQLKGSLPDLVATERLLREFTEKFPQQPGADRLQRLHRDCRIGIDLERGAQWPGTTDEAVAARAKQFLSLPEARGSVWQEPLAWFARWPEAAARGKEAAKALRELKNNWRLHDVYSFVRKDRRTGARCRYYYLGKVEQLRMGVIGDQPFYSFGVNIILPDDKHELRKFSSATADLSFAEKPEENLAPHCKVVRSVIAGLDELDFLDWEAFLLRKAEELRTDEEADPVVRVLLLQILLRQAKHLSSEHKAALDEVLDRLGKVNTNLYWMDPEPDDETALAKGKLAALLAGLPEVGVLAERTTIQGRLYRECVARKVRCIGEVPEGGGLPELQSADAKPAEVWIVTADEFANPAVYVIAERNKNGILQMLPQMAQRLYPGQPLFAPADGRRTADLVNEVFDGVRPDSTYVSGAIAWPLCWPVNARRPARMAAGE